MHACLHADWAAVIEMQKNGKNQATSCRHHGDASQIADSPGLSILYIAGK
jgi:hypothetical protein